MSSHFHDEEVSCPPQFMYIYESKKGVVGDDGTELYLPFEQLHGDLNKSVDINFPILQPLILEFGCSSQPFSGDEEDVYDRKLKHDQASKKRKTSSPPVANSPRALDLDLKLAPISSGTKPTQGHDHHETTSSSLSSPPSSSSCMSQVLMDDKEFYWYLESSENSKSTTTTKLLLPTDIELVASILVVMGCPNCLIYVMVSDSDPECPYCRNSDRLIDTFRSSKRVRSF